MSSSADRRPGRRVLREADAGPLPMASVVAPRGTVVQVEPPPGPPGTPKGPTLDEQLAEARRAGYLAGREEALGDALLQAEQERAAALRAISSSLSEACRSLTRERHALVQEVVGEAVDLAFELLEALVSHELEQDDSPVRSAVTRALSMVPEGEDVRVRVNPEIPLSAAELASLGEGNAILLLKDPAVEATGCIVEAGACRIDAQIGPAMERVRSVLEQLRCSGGEGAGR